MTDNCRYKKKHKRLLKGYYLCKRSRFGKVVKDCGKCMWYKPSFLKSIFVAIKELFSYDR